MKNFKNRFSVVSVMLAVLLTGCGEKGNPVSQAEFGETWPLTVPEGRVVCTRWSEGRNAVTFITEGKEYALNGTARQSGYFEKIDAIQAPNPANPPAKKDIGVLIDAGLKLCPQN